MTKPLIIGLTGYAESGKDTVGKKLILRHGFARLAFADVLKNLAREINPTVYVPGTDSVHTVEYVSDLRSELDRYVGDGWDGAKKLQDVRVFLQNLGDGVRRVLGEDTWVNPVRNHLIENTQAKLRTVFTDVRYPNELKLVQDFGGKIVRVERPGKGPVNGHVTETALDHIVPDYTIVNDGTLKDLAAKVDEVIRDIEAVR